MPVAKRSKNQRDVKPLSGALNKTVARIRGLQVEFKKCLGNAVIHFVQIGVELARAKKKMARGEWKELLTKTGIDVRTAERLIQLSLTPLARKMRTVGTHLGPACTLDLQKLVSLGRLPEELLDEGLKTIDLATNRKQVASQVNLLLKGQNSNSNSETTEDDEVEYEDPADDRGDDDATDGQYDDEQAQDPADEDEASDSNAEGSEETSDDDEQQAGEEYAEESDEPTSDEPEGQDPFWLLADVVQQLGDELVDSAVDAIQSAAYDPDSLGDVAAALRTCRSRLLRVLQAVESQLATVEESP